MSYQQLYEQLVTQHANDVVRYFSRWRVSSAEMDDLVQEAFLEAWKSIVTYRGDAPLKMWLLSICRRIAWRFAKQRSENLEQLTDVLPAEQMGEDGRSMSEQRAGIAMIRKFLLQLSEEHQEVMHLYYMMQMSEREIAQHLALAQGTIHSRLRTARQRLQVFCQAEHL